MLKVLKNLKKSFWSVVVIILLLIVQAQADLNLPDFTSRIVNEGIQFGGIEKAVPQIISKQDLENILIFSEDDDKITENYTLVGESPSKEQEKVLKKYLGKDFDIELESIYVLNDIDSSKEDELAKLMAGPLMEFATVTSEDTAAQIKTAMMSKVPEEQKAVLENMSILDIIKSMPEEQGNAVLEQFTKQVDEMQDSIKEQAAITEIKNLYKDLGVDTDKLQNNYILITGLQMLGVALISMLSAITIMLLSARVAAKLGKTLREKVFKKVLSFSTGELNRFSTASLITRSTNDVQQIQMLISILFRVVVYAPIIGIGGFIKVLTNSDSSMAWIIGVAILAVLFIVVTLFIIAMPKFRKLQELTDKLNLVSREILSGLQVIRAFNTEKKEEKRFNGANKDLMKTNVFVNRTMSIKHAI